MTSQVDTSRNFTPKTGAEKVGYSGKPAPKQIDSDWQWIEHEDEFAARMAAIRG
jgi:hypothetical protein